MKVSNSMMASAQKCDKRFEYEHVYKIRPKHFPEAMERGIAGHTLMEVFFLKKQEGGSYDECLEAVNAVLPEIMAKTPSVTGIYRHVLAFGAYVFQQEWEVVSVEVNHLLPLGVFVERGGKQEEIEFAWTADIVFKWTSGPRKNYHFMVDFKFTGQYWSDAELAVYQQLPKYVIYTNKLEEVQIKHAGLVMLNTRAAVGATGQNLFMLKWVNLKKEKLDNIEAENLLQAVKVAQMRVDGETGSRPFLRTVDTFSCKMCFFAQDICPAQLEGRDITKMVERNYVHNTYFEDNYGDKKK